MITKINSELDPLRIAVKAAVWLYLKPVAAFVGEALIFGITPRSTTLIGGSAIIAGALPTNRSRQ